MFHVVGTPIGVLCGILLFLYVLKSKIVIGRPYSYMDWLVVNSGTMVLLIFLMILEWSAYSAALSVWGDESDSNLLVFLLKKSCFVPLVSLGISCAWGKLCKRRYLFYAEGYSSWTAVCSLSAIVATICLNVQWILLPDIDDVILQDFMQDSVVAWALMVVGTFFGLGVGCAGRGSASPKMKATLLGFTVPVLSAVAIGIFGFVASILHISFLIPSCFVAAIITAFIFCLAELIRRPSLKRVVRRIRKANKSGYKSRETYGEYKGIRFHIEGEWLIIERDNLVKYRGANEEFDRLFGYQRLRIGTRVEQVKKILINRHEGQVKFVKTESKRALEFPGYSLGIKAVKTFMKY